MQAKIDNHIACVVGVDCNLIKWTFTLQNYTISIIAKLSIKLYFMPMIRAHKLEYILILFILPIFSDHLQLHYFKTIIIYIIMCNALCSLGISSRKTKIKLNQCIF